jgi:hypothetical protein
VIVTIVSTAISTIVTTAIVAVSAGNKNETSAALLPGADRKGGWPDSQLTASGKFVKQASLVYFHCDRYHCFHRYFHHRYYRHCCRFRRYFRRSCFNIAPMIRMPRIMRSDLNLISKIRVKQL